MNVFDLIILAILVLFVLRGAVKGMVSQIVSLGSCLVCWIFASRFAFIIAPSVPAVEPWNQVGAIAVLFVIALFGIRFLHGIIEKWIKKYTLAHRTNMLLGGGFGFIKAMLLCMVITFFGVMLTEATRTVIFNSKSGLKISKLIAKTGAFIPKGSCLLLEEQLVKFTAAVDGTPLDPNNETGSTAEILQDSLNELKQTVDRHIQKSPSGENNTAITTAFADILKRGETLLEKTKQIKEAETAKPAASLFDGILEWWSGKPALPEAETDAGSGKLTAQAIQNEIGALIQEGKNTVQEKISSQSVEKIGGTLADIKPVVPQTAVFEPVIPKEVNPSALLPDTVKTVPQSSAELLFPLAEKQENSVPDITALPFLKALREEPSEQYAVQNFPQITAHAVPLPRRTEAFILQNNRQGRLKTADILNSKPLVPDSVLPPQPALLFHQ